MFRSRKYYNVDFSELNRRIRRQFEGNFSYRKLFIILFLTAVFLLYIGPYIFTWLFNSTSLIKGACCVTVVFLQWWWWWNLIFLFLCNFTLQIQSPAVWMTGWRRSMQKVQNTMRWYSTMDGRMIRPARQYRWINTLYRMWAMAGLVWKSTWPPICSSSTGVIYRSRSIIIPLCPRWSHRIVRQMTSMLASNQSDQLWLTMSMALFTISNALAKICLSRTISTVSTEPASVTWINNLELENLILILYCPL